MYHLAKLRCRCVDIMVSHQKHDPPHSRTLTSCDDVTEITVHAGNEEAVTCDRGGPNPPAVGDVRGEKSHWRGSRGARFEHRYDRATVIHHACISLAID